MATSIEEKVYLLKQKLEISSFLFWMHACQLLVTMDLTIYINDEHLDELEHKTGGCCPHHFCDQSRSHITLNIKDVQLWVFHNGVIIIS